MKNVFTLFSFLSLAILGSANLNAQDFTLCGTSSFTINCNGTVDVVLGSDVMIYKVWNGGTLIAEFNNYNPSIPNIPPFAVNPGFTSGVNFGNVVPVGQNYWVQVQTAGGCVDELNISQYLDDPANCTRFDLCGSTFNVDVDCAMGTATIDFNFLDNVEIFKAWDFNDNPALQVELNNYDSNPFNNVPSGLGNSATAGPDGIVNPGDNFYIEVVTSNGCNAGENISQILSAQFAQCGFKKENTITEIEESEITVYPNPTIDNVKLDLPLIEDQYTIGIYDLSGKLISESISQGGTVSVEMTDLNAGVYILNILSEEYNHTERVQLVK